MRTTLLTLLLILTTLLQTAREPVLLSSLLFGKFSLEPLPAPRFGRP